MGKLFHKCKLFLKDQEGSEATEMIYSIAIAVSLIILALLIMSYVLLYNNTVYATRSVVRSVETSGYVGDVNTEFKQKISGSAALTNPSARIVQADYMPGTNKIQACDTFTMESHADYVLSLFAPGGFATGDTNMAFRFLLPINVTVTGMSEVFWKN